MRAAKRRLRALQPGEEPNLYDQDAEASEDEDLETEDEEESHTNGHTPEEPEFLDTADEDELRTIISNIDDVVEVLLPIPEWKYRDPKDGKIKIVTVMIRSLTSFERTQFIKAMNRNGPNNIDITKMYADLVILSARHPKKKTRLFKDADRGMLNTKHGAATERIAMRASDISGLSEAFLADMRKNW
jgi:hypothetical protein